jgi:hypothetical protein
MCNEVEDFGFADSCQGQDVFDVFDVTATSEVDQNDGEGYECDVDQL